MKPTDKTEHPRLVTESYDYHSYSPDFVRMQNDLVFTGTCLIILGALMLFLLSGVWYQEPTLLTLAGYTLGGVLGLMLPWIGIERTKLVGHHLGAPDHLTHFEHRLQVVIWKFRNHTAMILFTSPYFLWVFYHAYKQSVPIGNNYSDAILITLLSAVCMFGFAMGVLAWQVQWSLGRERHKHEKKQ